MAFIRKEKWRDLTIVWWMIKAVNIVSMGQYELCYLTWKEKAPVQSHFLPSLLWNLSKRFSLGASDEISDACFKWVILKCKIYVAKFWAESLTQNQFWVKCSFALYLTEKYLIGLVNAAFFRPWLSSSSLSRF